MSARLHRFSIQLDDRLRDLREAFELRVWQHPSEDVERVVLRVLAACYLWQPGLELESELCRGDQPALFVPGPDGRPTVAAWVGRPDLARIAKAARGGTEVLVLTHGDPAPLLRAALRQRFARDARVRLLVLETAMVRRLAESSPVWEVEIDPGEIQVSLEEGEKAASQAQEFMPTFGR